MFPVKQHWLCKALGCYDCCIRCIGAVPYPSLVATLLCYAGTALFCGCGYEALAQTEVLVKTHFAREPKDYEVMASFIKYFQFVIYGLASFFFLYGILLLAEGFYATSAVKQTFGEFRSTQCGRCLSLTFVIVTYILAFIWLAVFAFSAIPVFFLFNMEHTCHTINIQAESSPVSLQNWICIDARQFGLLPWDVMPGKSCGMTLAAICKTSEFHSTYDLYIATFAGAGVNLLALILYLVPTTYNYAVLRFLGRKGIR
ncbi:proteolipid protein 1b isoform X1 [Cyprinodon tularosa]|uniref:proteolipid protein 1b isoform X1 n=1 Tax=Cyprinodon tularosa TaxID=77115 RepID=UPI0018E23CAB|nr:proteolipid protein 1b isoform X1 [Cyprinodon tularosa]